MTKFCANCNKTIQRGSLTTPILGFDYHTYCLHCKKCGASLWDKPFMKRSDGSLQCLGGACEKPVSSNLLGNRTLLVAQNTLHPRAAFPGEDQEQKSIAYPQRGVPTQALPPMAPSLLAPGQFVPQQNPGAGQNILFPSEDHISLSMPFSKVGMPTALPPPTAPAAFLTSQQNIRSRPQPGASQQQQQQQPSSSNVGSFFDDSQSIGSFPGAYYAPYQYGRDGILFCILSVLMIMYDFF